MNTFITPDALDALLRQSGVHRPASQRAYESLRSNVNKAAWQIFSRLLDVIRISTESGTIRPSHVYNLMRVVAMMAMPLRDGVTSRRIMKKDLSRIMHGGDPVLPGSYFSPSNPVDAARYTASAGADYTALAGDPGFVRAGIDASSAPPSCAPTFGGGAGGAGILSAGGAGSAGILSAGGLGAGGAVILSEAAVNALLAEYRARITSTLRLGKGTRTLVTRVVSTNLVELMRKNGKKAISTTLHSWKLLI